MTRFEHGEPIGDRSYPVPRRYRVCSLIVCVQPRLGRSCDTSGHLVKNSDHLRPILRTSHRRAASEGISNGSVRLKVGLRYGMFVNV